MADISVLSGLRVLVVGLGREGIALTRYLVDHGMAVTVTDLQPAEKLGSTLASLFETGVSWVLGGHPLSLLDEADILFVSPGVPLENPFLQEARARKIPLCTETKLFCYLCPAPIIAITGSSGKTTTTTLLGKVMETAGRTTWVGGNIGRPLIEVVDQIEPDDTVVMELSSFQLEYFHAYLNQDVDLTAISCPDPAALAALLGGWSPPISAILNITPNHLDRHPSMKHYVRAKRAIINYQGAEGIIVMNLDNDMTRTIGSQFGSKVCWFSLEAQVPHGACFFNDQIMFLDQDEAQHLIANRQEIRLRGRHNLSNILAVCLLARAAGVPTEAIRTALTTFAGVDHRLQLIREFNQVNYYNDSVSTTPERLIAALHSFDEPIILLAGGRDKHLPWDDVARLMIHKTRAVILFGEATELIARAINKVRPEISITDTALHRCANLTEAVNLAAKVAQPGNVVLLSPGCASFDQFSNFAERGERFKELVLQL